MAASKVNNIHFDIVIAKNVSDALLMSNDEALFK